MASLFLPYFLSIPHSLSLIPSRSPPLSIDIWKAAVSMEQPQPGPSHHGPSNRIKHVQSDMRYQSYAEGHEHLRPDQVDWRTHVIRMQQKLKVCIPV